MAYDDNEELDDLGVFDEEEVDTAMDLTSGLVITTTVCLLVAMITVFYALDKFYAVGPMAN